MSTPLHVMFVYSHGMTIDGPSKVAFAGHRSSSPVTFCISL